MCVGLENLRKCKNTKIRYKKHKPEKTVKRKSAKISVRRAETRKI